MKVRQVTLEEAQMFWELGVNLCHRFRQLDGTESTWSKAEHDPVFSPKADFDQFGTRPHLLYHWGVEVDGDE